MLHQFPTEIIPALIPVNALAKKSGKGRQVIKSHLTQEFASQRVIKTINSTNINTTQDFVNLLGKYRNLFNQIIAFSHFFLHGAK